MKASGFTAFPPAPRRAARSSLVRVSQEVRTSTSSTRVTSTAGIDDRVLEEAVAGLPELAHLAHRHAAREHPVGAGGDEQVALDHVLGAQRVVELARPRPAQAAHVPPGPAAVHLHRHRAVAIGEEEDLGAVGGGGVHPAHHPVGHDHRFHAGDAVLLAAVEDQELQAAGGELDADHLRPHVAARGRGLREGEQLAEPLHLGPILEEVLALEASALTSRESSTARSSAPWSAT